MLPIVALFIAVPILELWVIIEIGGLLGVLPTLALLFAMSVLGASLLRRQGREAWQRFNGALGQRRFPGREVADGLLITIGGALLLTPGFITDAVGLAFLLPPTRALARRLLGAWVARRFVVVGSGGMGGPGGFGGFGRRGPGGPEGPGGPGGPGDFGDPGGTGGGFGAPPPPRRDYDYEGTAEEVDEEGRELRE